MPRKNKDGRPAVEHSQTGKVDVNKVVSARRRTIIKASAVAVPAIMTLRSGTAAAMNSSYQCFLHGADATNVDPVIGDGDGIPHDEWTRMDAKPVYCVTGNNNKSSYALRKENTTYTWDQVEGWDWYPFNFSSNGKILSTPEEILGDAHIPGAWGGRTAVYCTPADPTGWNCIDEDGNLVNTTIPDQAISDCNVIVKLLVYYDPDSGYMGYYPMTNELPGVALAITESCMCSIRPDILVDV
jgi:hypothetical protein